MYEQPSQDDILFYMLYAGVAVMSLTASCYLLFRRGNAFNADITTPKRLRRWTAAFFACIALSHIWYLPIAFLTSTEDIMMCYFIGAMLDFMTTLPLAISVLIAMLQDRRRKLWPVGVIAAPPAAGMLACIVTRSDALLPAIYTYLLIVSIGIIIYMVREVRKYGRWLRDNYADLEHKEVWQNFVVLAAILLLLGIYVSGSAGPVYRYAINLIEFVFIGYMLWRVETLSDLSSPQALTRSSEEESTEKEPVEDDGNPPATNDYMGALLQQHCIDAQLYLQHDLSLAQLAQAIGTNRFYLSQYFSSQGMTYNAYINDLRIQHFVRLYREAVDAQRPFTTKQLAHDSGYRSYSTFSLAFKQRMGENVTTWMHEATG